MKSLAPFADYTEVSAARRPATVRPTAPRCLSKTPAASRLSAENFPVLGNVQPNPVRLDEPVTQSVHAASSTCSQPRLEAVPKLSAAMGVDCSKEHAVRYAGVLRL